MFTKSDIGLPLAASPVDMLRQMTAELHRVVAHSRLRQATAASRNAARPITWYPDTDVFECEDHLVTRIDLPGMKREAVDIAVDDGQLTIAGERKTAVGGKNEHFYRCEREHGRFYCAIPLPAGVGLAAISATFADGVLEVSIPLPPAAVPRAKPIQLDEPGTAANPAA